MGEDGQEDGQTVSDRHPAEVVEAMVERVLELAGTWPAWDGVPVTAPTTGGSPRVYTPHKAVRRVADHLVDHLAELEARVAGIATLPDAWHASSVTTPADLAPFTPADLDEARSRLSRLALIWGARLRALPSGHLDAAPAGAWSLRQVAFHVAESVLYAEWVGHLGPEGHPDGERRVSG